jgi:3-oxoacyl-[acyl-carrier protein] reductase
VISSAGHIKQSDLRFAGRTEVAVSEPPLPKRSRPLAPMWITCEKSADAAATVVGAIKAIDRRGVSIQANSADAEAVQASVEKAVAALGGIDILDNNAGILRLAEVKDISQEDIDALLNINVRAPIVASKAAIPHLGEGGRIINIGSFFADRVPPGAGLAVYALSKSALTAFSRGLARELGARNITVNVVQLGSIDTDMNPAHGPFGETLRALTALGRYGRVEEIADVVTFLAGPKAQYITGTTLTVDGGANA